MYDFRVATAGFGAYGAMAFYQDGGCAFPCGELAGDGETHGAGAYYLWVIVSSLLWELRDD
jgi:hypothetical protein